VGKVISYRQYAAECISIAGGMHDGEQRSQLLKIAAEWRALADAAEKRSNHYTVSPDQRRAIKTADDDASSS